MTACTVSDHEKTSTCLSLKSTTPVPCVVPNPLPVMTTSMRGERCPDPGILSPVFDLAFPHPTSIYAAKTAKMTGMTVNKVFLFILPSFS